VPDRLQAVGFEKAGDGFVEAFAKGLAVISVFNGEKRALSMAEVAERAALPRAGARRLLYTLVQLGYARHDEGRFELTPKIIELGRAFLSSAANLDFARPIVEALARDTGELCTMSLLDGVDVVYVVRVEPALSLTRSYGVGSRLPAYATSMGRVLLAGLQPQNARAILKASDLHKLTSRTKTDVDVLMAEIERAGRAGWCLVQQEIELGVCGLSAAVKGRQGATRAAVSISFNMSRFDRKDALEVALPRLLKAAGELARLGD
jgi:IclR family transcriptional regulator, pca regulon regulatory protein